MTDPILTSYAATAYNAMPLSQRPENGFRDSVKQVQQTKIQARLSVQLLQMSSQTFAETLTDAEADEEVSNTIDVLADSYQTQSKAFWVGQVLSFEV